MGLLLKETEATTEDDFKKVASKCRNILEVIYQIFKSIKILFLQAQNNKLLKINNLYLSKSKNDQSELFSQEIKD